MTTSRERPIRSRY